MNIGTFADRIRMLIGEETVSGFASKCGLRNESIRQYLAGSIPGMDKVVAIAQATGVQLEWLATGKGSMWAADATAGDGTQTAANAGPVDAELMARLTDGITRVYKDLGSRISPADAVRVAAPEYEKITALAADPAERLVMVRLAVENVRRQLQASNDAASRKQQG